MPNSVSQADIDAFVHQVIGWTQVWQQYADAAVNKAHQQPQAQTISLSIDAEPSMTKRS